MGQRCVHYTERDNGTRVLYAPNECTDVSCDNNVRLVKWSPNHVIPYSATSASSDKTAFAFNFLDALCALKSSNDACQTEIHITVHSYQVYQARPQTSMPRHSYAGSGLAW